MQGDYDKAVEYFGHCYDICSQLDDKEALHSARVQFGIAKGHQFMRNYFSCVNELPGSSSFAIATISMEGCESFSRLNYFGQ